MGKHRIKKAKALIKRWNDSWGSLEFKFKHRQLDRQEIKEQVKDL
jgi:hypothetical protein